jgi:hypothetical protein
MFPRPGRFRGLPDSRPSAPIISLTILRDLRSTISEYSVTFGNSADDGDVNHVGWAFQPDVSLESLNYFCVATARRIPGLAKGHLGGTAVWVHLARLEYPPIAVGSLSGAPATGIKKEPIPVREFRVLLVSRQFFRTKLASFRKNSHPRPTSLFRSSCLRLPIRCPWVRSSCFRLLNPVAVGFVSQASIVDSSPPVTTAGSFVTVDAN